MGFLLLVAAMYFAGGRLVHGPDLWWLIVGVVAIASLYLVARSVQLTKNARPVGIAAAIAVLMLGGTLWWTGRMTGVFSQSGSGGAVEATWQPYTDEAFEQSRAAGKMVLVKFTANWCGTCQYIEGTVFRDANVWKVMKQRDV